MDTDKAPTDEEWRALYEAATRFKKARPWMWMLEDDLFGVENPETGELGFVSIMGAGGEHYALSVYLGAEGLSGFWDIQSEPELVDVERMLAIPQLQASFEDRNDLEVKDRETIKSLGLKFRGRKEWPLFRSIIPGHWPWFITAPEARSLTVALEQALEVAPRLQEDPDLLAPPEGREDEYLVRARVDGVWQDTRRDVPLLEPEPFDLTLDEETVARLRKLRKKRAVWQADIFALPGGVQEERNARPVLAFTLLLIDPTSGVVLGMELLSAEPTLDEMWQQVPGKLGGLLLELRARPATLEISSSWLADTFQPVADAVGIELDFVDFLPEMSFVKASLMGFMG